MNTPKKEKSNTGLVKLEEKNKTSKNIFTEDEEDLLDDLGLDF